MTITRAQTRAILEDRSLATTSSSRDMLLAALRIALETYCEVSGTEWGDGYAYNAAGNAFLAELETCPHDLAWFWEIVDRYDHNGVPSDEPNALARICSELEQARKRIAALEAQPSAQPNIEDAAKAAFLAHWPHYDWDSRPPEDSVFNKYKEIAQAVLATQPSAQSSDNNVERVARIIREEIVRQYRDDERGKCPAGRTFYEEQISPELIAVEAIKAMRDSLPPAQFVTGMREGWAVMSAKVEKARLIEEYHEDMGVVLWWKFPVEEPPYVGSPHDLGRSVEITIRDSIREYRYTENIGGWPGYHTHFTPLPPIPEAASIDAARAILAEAALKGEGE